MFFSSNLYRWNKNFNRVKKNGSIAFVDSDKSQLSQRLIDAFYKPRFNTPDIISYYDIDKRWIQDITLLLF